MVSRHILAVLLLSLLSETTHGQVIDEPWTHPYFYLKNEMAIREVGQKGSEEIAGSPFYNESFISGELLLQGGKRFQNVDMRVDFGNDELQYRYKGIVYALENTSIIDEVILEQDTFVCAALHPGDKSPHIFFQRLLNGRTQLLKRINIIFRAAAPPKAYADAKPAEYFRQADTYYVKVNGQPPERISGMDKLIKILQTQEKELKAYAKKEKISVRSEEELIRFFSYYDSLGGRTIN